MKPVDRIIELAIKHTYTIRPASTGPRSSYMCMALLMLYFKGITTYEEADMAQNTVISLLYTETKTLEGSISALHKEDLGITRAQMKIEKEKFWRKNFDLPRDLDFHGADK